MFYKAMIQVLDADDMGVASHHIRIGQKSHNSWNLVCFMNASKLYMKIGSEGRCDGKIIDKQLCFIPFSAAVGT